MKIREKLFLGYLLVALLVEVVGFFSLQAISQTQSEFKQVVENVVPLRNQLEQVRGNVNQLTKATVEIALVSAAESKQRPLGLRSLSPEAQVEIDRELRMLQTSQYSYRHSMQQLALLSQRCEKAQSFYERLLVQGEEVVRQSNLLTSLVKQGATQAELFHHEEKLEVLRDRYLATVQQAIAAKDLELAEVNNRSQITFRNVTWMVLAIGLLAFLVAVVMGASISLSISRPLNRIKAAAQKIGTGQLRTQIEVYRQDELGELVQTFNRMTESLWQMTAYAVKVRESMVESLIVLKPDSLTIHSVNRATARLLGYSRRSLVGERIDKIAPKVASLLQGATLEQLTHKGFIHNIETVYCASDGRQIPVLFSASLMQTRATLLGIVCVAQDITEWIRSQQELQRSFALVQATLEATADGILVVNQQGVVEGFNQKFLEMWRIPPALAEAQQDHEPLLQFVLGQLKNPQVFLDKVQALYSQPDAISNDVLEFKDGRIFERYSQPQRLQGTVVGRVWSFRDVTERHQQERTIRYQATHDLLTGLPNRMLFNTRLLKALSAASQNDHKLAVMFLDLDRFKLINDTLGHAAGDRLLKEVTHRLLTCLRQTDTLARWAGDEFTLLLPELHQVQDALTVAQKILEALKPPFELEGRTVRMSCSIGLAIAPTDGNDAETLLKNADAALYRSKEGGRNGYHFFTAALNSEATERLTLENHLHHALERQEFSLVYQPRIQVSTGAITHLEALLRWKHPTLGVIPPSRFIPLAEETGLIVPLGKWVLQTACAQGKQWREAGFSSVQVAVNLSVHQFRQPDLVGTIHHILVETGLPPQALELEITETTVMKNVELAKTLLARLNHLGISIALDDFGTGYSSLSYLKQFPFHTLKIDRSFVRDLTSDPNDRAIVAAIIAMGEVLNLNLVAEGVETEVQQYLLRSLGCDNMQGFLFSPPVSATAVTQLLCGEWRSPKLSLIA